MTYREKFPQLYAELDAIRDAPKPVFLTPDDILTLKLLRDTYMKELHGSYGKSIRDWERLLQTLERILKQIQ